MSVGTVPAQPENLPATLAYSVQLALLHSFWYSSFPNGTGFASHISANGIEWVFSQLGQSNNVLGKERLVLSFSGVANRKAQRMAERKSVWNMLALAAVDRRGALGGGSV